MPIKALTIARFSVLEALNSKLIYINLALMLIAGFIGLFVGEIALTETTTTQLAIMAGFIRLSAILAILFYVISSIARDFQDKTVELLFSANVTRVQIFIGKYLGFVCINLLSSLAFSLLLMLFGDVPGSILWGISLFLELCLVSLIGFILILALENITLSISVAIGVYLLTRAMPAIQAIGEGPFQQELPNQVINFMIDFIDMLLPRLADFSQVSWLTVPGRASSEITSIMLETVIYGSVFLLVGIFDLRRKAL